MLNNAFVTTTNEYKSNASSGTVKKWRDLKEELAGLLERLEDQYDLGQNSPVQFKSKAAVLRWLGDNGWQISRTQFYAHCAEGLLRARKGVYSLKVVEKYASLHVKKAETGQKENDRLTKQQEIERQLDIDIKEIKKKKEQHGLDVLDKKYIPRDEFELAIAGRAVAFMAHLNHMVQQNVPDWIDLVSGDQDSAAELVEAISVTIGERMSDFSADAEIDVIFDAE